MSPSALPYLEHYGVVILPALAVAEQIGLPLPAMPALLAVGALAAHGRSSIPLVLGAISAAALAVDFALELPVRPVQLPVVAASTAL